MLISMSKGAFRHTVLINCSIDYTILSLTMVHPLLKCSSMTIANNCKPATSKLSSALSSVRQLMSSDTPISASLILPLLFNLKGKPYSLTWSHFMFEPLFKLKNTPKREVWRCARQISKTTSISAAQIVAATIEPGYNVVTITPFYEQVRKISNNYVRPFIKGSPFFKNKISSADSVMQRSFENDSNLYFSFVFGNADRARGIAGDELNVDEVQDVDVQEIDVVEQCLAASRHRRRRYTGTPKTFDNTIQQFYEKSSQAHWHIKCTSCGYDNRCAIDSGLLKMIGEETLVCAECQTPLNSRAGFWVHEIPSLQKEFAGYHVPQVVLPMHYENPSNWKEIKDIIANKPAYFWHNEILGESYDVGAQLVTVTDIKNASVVQPCDYSNFPRGKYTTVSVGVDWGGRGKEKTSDSSDFISNTVIVAGGMLPNGVIEISWLYRVPYEINQIDEPVLVAKVAGTIGADWVAVDYGGQGNVQEDLVINAGWPNRKLVPFTYSVLGKARPIVVYNKPLIHGSRSSFTLDKPRSLLLLCELIRRKFVLLANAPHYISQFYTDFYALYEESTEGPRGSPLRLVKRKPRKTDDVVHAINFLVMSIYHSTGRWPAIASAFVEQN